MGRILEEGLAAVEQGRVRDQWIAGASTRFEAIGSPQALQAAQLIRENPEAATQYMEQFGGWSQVYNLMRADAARTALSAAIGQLGGDVSEQDALRQILPVAIQHGVGAEMAATIAKAYGRASVQPNVGAASPNDFTPESLAEYARTGDYGALVRVPSAAPPATAADYTSASIRRWQQTGNIADLVPIPKPAGEGQSAESRAIDLEIKRLNLRKHQDDDFVRLAIEDDAAGKPITKSRARRVNNILKMYPDPYGAPRPVFQPELLVDDHPAGKDLEFDDLKKATPTQPKKRPGASGNW